MKNITCEDIAACLSYAVKELREHNNEYHHRTPKEEIQKIEALAKRFENGWK